MARPHKQTVDYFPHDTDASDGKTLTIIQSKYGNDGYAFWFKLLQLLGKSPGHFYDFNNPADWEFLLAKTHQKSTEITKNILKTLVELDAVDEELYKSGVIWCQKFTDRVLDAYSRTLEGAPKRPEHLVNVVIKDVSANNNHQKSTLIPQTKRKLKGKGKGKETETILPDWINKNIWDSFLEMRKGLRAIPTENAKALLIKELEKLKLAGDDPNEVLNQSIMNNYKGVFPLKKGGKPYQGDTKDRYENQKYGHMVKK